MFNSKQPAIANKGELTFEKFRFYYLYGFTNDPNRSSADATNFEKLYRLVIGQIGGIAIRHSYHPYFLVNRKGTTPWIVAYVRLFMQENKQEIYNKMLVEKAVYTADTANAFTEAVVWPDKSLLPEINPGFATYAPFIIPFLVPDTRQALQWDMEIQNAINADKYADAYVLQVTEAIRFFMPAPAFVVGFDEFDEKNPSVLINKFVFYLPALKR